MDEIPSLLIGTMVLTVALIAGVGLTICTRQFGPAEHRDFEEIRNATYRAVYRR